MDQKPEVMTPPPAPPREELADKIGHDMDCLYYYTRPGSWACNCHASEKADSIIAAGWSRHSLRAVVEAARALNNFTVISFHKSTQPNAPSFYSCRECAYTWLVGKDESHAENCSVKRFRVALAALGDTGERDGG